MYVAFRHRLRARATPFRASTSVLGYLINYLDELLLYKVVSGKNFQIHDMCVSVLSCFWLKYLYVTLFCSVFGMDLPVFLYRSGWDLGCFGAGFGIRFGFMAGLGAPPLPPFVGCVLLWCLSGGGLRLCR